MSARACPPRPHRAHPVEAHAGYLVKTTGDGVHAAFTTASGALEAAVEAQRMLVAEHWVSDDPLALHGSAHGFADTATATTSAPP